MTSVGAKDLDFARRLYAAIRDACVAHDCFNVLGIGDTTSAQSTADAFENAGLFRELGITPRYRIAWVESNAEARKTAQFIETVLVNRGFAARLFENEADARAWLLEGAQ